MYAGALLLLALAADPMADDFAWFDTLGLPSLAEAPCVRVATGQWARYGNDDPVNTYRLGFLLREGPGWFEVVFPDLETRRFETTPPATAGHERVGYERQDFAQVVADMLELREKEDGDQRFDRRWGASIGEAAELFALARICDAHGRDDAARRVYDAACDARGRDARDLRAVVADQIAHAWMWRAVAGFEDPAVPWTTHRDRLRRIATHFPGSEHHDRARDLADLLDRMIAEFAAHRDGEDRIAELVFRLPEQNGRQWSQPGACSPLNDPRGIESAACALVGIGWDAIPALIEALVDERLTRCVTYHRDFYFSHRILRVKEVAADALDAITCGELALWDPEGDPRERARAWWREHGPRGERALLERGLRAGGNASIPKAYRMLERYPDALLDPLCTGIERATDDGVRAGLLQVLGRLDAPQVEAVLREELENAPGIQARVEAAVGLLARGRREAIDAMLDEWRAGGPRFDGLVEFLCGCRDPRAIEALGARPLDLHVAMDVAFELADDDAWIFMVREVRLPPAPPEWGEAAEKLLLRLADDTREWRGLSTSRGNLSFQDPRVCDVAAAVLHERWPERYEFDANATILRRDRQRLAILGRTRAGPFVVVPMADTRAVPLLRAVLDAPADEAAVAALEAHGLPALAWMERQAGRDAWPGTLQALRRRLASLVGRVEWEDGGADPGDDLRAVLEGMCLAPLDPEALAQVVTGFAKRAPPGACGLKLLLAREGDANGVVLRVFLHPGEVPDGGPPEGWDHRVVIRSPERSIRESSRGSGTNSWAQRRDCWKDWIEKVAAAMQLAPDVPFEAILELTPDEG